MDADDEDDDVFSLSLYVYTILEVEVKVKTFVGKRARQLLRLDWITAAGLLLFIKKLKLPTQRLL